jgi:hypothetical protein
MRSILLLLASVGVAACSHGSADEGFQGYIGTATGVIVLPDGQAGDEACTQLSVYATVTDDKGQVQRVGRANVHRGNGRCSYTVGELPADMPVTLHVEPAGGMKCGNGTSLAFASQAQQSFTLKSDQMGVTRDFQPQCSATTSSL